MNSHEFEFDSRIMNKDGIKKNYQNLSTKKKFTIRKTFLLVGMENLFLIGNTKCLDQEKNLKLLLIGEEKVLNFIFKNGDMLME